LLGLALCIGCSLDERSWISDEVPISSGSEALTIQAALAIPETVINPLLPSPVTGPNRVTLYVGDDLLLDLELVNPDDFQIVATQLPANAVFIPDFAGGQVQWSPALSDVGLHNLTFMVVETDNPELVQANVAIEVSVLPRFGLIEYGF